MGEVENLKIDPSAQISIFFSYVWKGEKLLLFQSHEIFF